MSARTLEYSLCLYWSHLVLYCFAWGWPAVDVPIRASTVLGVTNIVVSKGWENRRRKKKCCVPRYVITTKPICIIGVTRKGTGSSHYILGKQKLGKSRQLVLRVWCAREQREPCIPTLRWGARAQKKLFLAFLSQVSWRLEWESAWWLWFSWSCVVKNDNNNHNNKNNNNKNVPWYTVMVHSPERATPRGWVSTRVRWDSHETDIYQ